MAHEKFFITEASQTEPKTLPEIENKGLKFNFRHRQQATNSRGGNQFQVIFTLCAYATPRNATSAYLYSEPHQKLNRVEIQL